MITVVLFSIEGIIAKKPIVEDQHILYVPGSLILSLSSALVSKDLVHRKIAKLFKDEDQAVIGILLLEKMKEDKSLWAPYFSILPKYVPNAALWGFIAPELQDHRLERAINESVNELDRNFKIFKKGISSIWPSGLSQPKFEDYRWARAIIDSRALRFEGRINLVPVADVFNYSPHPMPRRKNAGNFFLRHHKLNASGLFLSADRACDLNEQLFEDYGDNEDSIYLQYHGFVARKNPFRCVNFEVEFSKDLSLKAEKLKILFKKLRINSNIKKCVDPTGDVGLGILVYLTALNFDPIEASNCENSITESKNDWDIIGLKCGFTEVQSAVQEFIGAAVQRVKDTGHKLNAGADGFDQKSLFGRVVLNIRDRLDTYTRSFPSTVQQDDLLRENIYSNLTHNAEGSAELYKLLLSVEYRLAVKNHWRYLCCLYGAECCPNERKPTHVAKIGTAEVNNAMKENFPGKFNSTDLGLDKLLEEFMEWFKAANSQGNNKLAAVIIPGFRIGTIATENIRAGDIYSSVPLKLIMDAGKAKSRDYGIGELLRQLAAKFPSNRDLFHELLFFLLHERFVRKAESQFWPYLRLLPGPKEMDIPLIWQSDSDVAFRLGPSAHRYGAETYRNSVKQMYDRIVKVSIIRKFFGIDNSGGEQVLTLENYRWATAILDSRSIWWNGERHLVPLLDFVNCGIGPQEYQVHSTALDSAGENAITRAGWDFAAGEQIFENYGQPNHIYFMYHGFVLPINPFDCVSIKFSLTDSEIAILKLRENIILKEKLHLNDLSREYSICVNEKIQENLWLFMSIKTNTIDEANRLGSLGKPSKIAAEFFLIEVEKRISDYERYVAERSFSSVNVESEPNWMLFVKSELLMLNKIKVVLLSMLENLKLAAVEFSMDEL